MRVKSRDLLSAAAALPIAVGVAAITPPAYAACNPCKGATKAAACNPCAAKKAACNPCNPCAAKKAACSPCNPCAAKKAACSPCKPK